MVSYLLAGFIGISWILLISGAVENLLYYRSVHGIASLSFLVLFIPSFKKGINNKTTEIIMK
ncbi:MAG: hypothetical protein ACOC2K_00730 [Bacteroidota bacterium]